MTVVKTDDPPDPAKLEVLKLEVLKQLKQLELTQRAAQSEKERRWWNALGAAPLFVICTGLLVVVAYYLLDATAHHRAYYDQLLGHAKARSDAGTFLEGNYLQFVSVMSPTRDVLELRAVTLLLGFVVVLLGGLFVLQRVKDAAFSLNFEGQGTKAALATASPGLVLISFGVLIVLLALYRNTEVTTNFLSAVRSAPETAPETTDAISNTSQIDTGYPTEAIEPDVPANRPGAQGSGAKQEGSRE